MKKMQRRGKVDIDAKKVSGVLQVGNLPEGASVYMQGGKRDIIYTLLFITMKTYLASWISGTCNAFLII